MFAQAAWDTLPQDVLANVFKDLTFHSKIRVQFVCKAWSQVLQQPNAGSWADAVNLSRKTEMQLTNENTKDALALLPTYRIIHWLSKRIRGVSNVGVYSLDTSSPGWPTISNIFKHMLPDVSEAGLPELTVELRGAYPSSEHAFPCGYLL